MAHLDHVVARSVAELRGERGWSQKDLALRMSMSGLRWSPNRVSQVETLRRSLSFLEVLALAWTFEVPVDRLLAGDDEIQLPDSSTVSLGVLRDVLVGEAQVQKMEQREADDMIELARRAELRKLAGQVDLTAVQLDWLARAMWDRSFIDERDRRAAVPTDASERSARAYKAHATKGLMAEVRERIAEEGLQQVKRSAVVKQMEEMGRAMSGETIGFTPEDQAMLDEIEAGWDDEGEEA